jgi:hypothetical protein
MPRFQAMENLKGVPSSSSPAELAEIVSSMGSPSPEHNLAITTPTSTLEIGERLPLEHTAVENGLASELRGKHANGSWCSIILFPIEHCEGGMDSLHHVQFQPISSLNDCCVN